MYFVIERREQRLIVLENRGLRVVSEIRTAE
jgi:hypothetical protein